MKTEIEIGMAEGGRNETTTMGPGSGTMRVMATMTRDPSGGTDIRLLMFSQLFFDIALLHHIEGLLVGIISSVLRIVPFVRGKQGIASVDGSTLAHKLPEFTTGATVLDPFDILQSQG
jgi:hypothetical protein